MFCRKFISLVLCVTVVSTQGAFSSSDKFSALPAPPIFFPSVPDSLGTWRIVSSPARPNGPVVVHLLDVHRNSEAQTVISKTVSALTRSGIDLIGLEGAFSSIDLSLFGEFPHPPSLKVAADSLLLRHKITGPINAALREFNARARYVGVDDPAHHAKNVQAYVASRAEADRLKQEILRSKKFIRRLKKVVFNPDLARFDAAAQAYREERGNLGMYVERMSEIKPLPPALGEFLRVWKLESDLKFPRVEEERGAFLKGLLARQPLGAAPLIEAARRLRANEISVAAYYRFLLSLARQTNADPSAYKNFNAYTTYVFAAERLNSATLRDELESVEKQIYEKLLRTPQEKKLHDDDRLAGLKEKLAGFSLTREEWDLYRSVRGSNDSSLKIFEQFYEEARSRDGAMAANLLAAMKARGRKTAILVTGGFHSIGIDENLKAAGVTVYRFSPRLSATPADGSSYLTSFLADETALGGNPAPFAYLQEGGRNAALLAYKRKAADPRKLLSWTARLMGWRSARFVKTLSGTSVAPVQSDAHSSFAGWTTLLSLGTVALYCLTSGFRWWIRIKHRTALEKEQKRLDRLAADPFFKIYRRLQLFRAPYGDDIHWKSPLRELGTREQVDLVAQQTEKILSRSGYPVVFSETVKRRHALSVELKQWRLSDVIERFRFNFALEGALLTFQTQGKRKLSERVKEATNDASGLLRDLGFNPQNPPWSVVHADKLSAISPETVAASLSTLNHILLAHNIPLSQAGRFYIHEYFHTNSVGFPNIILNEGMTEIMTVMAIMRRDGVSNPAPSDIAAYIEKYVWRKTPGGHRLKIAPVYRICMQIVLNLMLAAGPQTVIEAYITGNDRRLEEILDERFGSMAWKEIVNLSSQGNLADMEDVHSTAKEIQSVFKTPDFTPLPLLTPPFSLRNLIFSKFQTAGGSWIPLEKGPAWSLYIAWWLEFIIVVAAVSLLPAGWDAAARAAAAGLLHFILHPLIGGILFKNWKNGLNVTTAKVSLIVFICAFGIFSVGFSWQFHVVVKLAALFLAQSALHGDINVKESQKPKLRVYSEEPSPQQTITYSRAEDSLNPRLEEIEDEVGEILKKYLDGMRIWKIAKAEGVGPVKLFDLTGDEQRVLAYTPGARLNDLKKVLPPDVVLELEKLIDAFYVLASDDLDVQAISIIDRLRYELSFIADNKVPVDVVSEKNGYPQIKITGSPRASNYHLLISPETTLSEVRRLLVYEKILSKTASYRTPENIPEKIPLVYGVPQKDKTSFRANLAVSLVTILGEITEHVNGKWALSDRHRIHIEITTDLDPRSPVDIVPMTVHDSQLQPTSAGNFEWIPGKRRRSIRIIRVRPEATYGQFVEAWKTFVGKPNSFLNIAARRGWLGEWGKKNALALGWAGMAIDALIMTHAALSMPATAVLVNILLLSLAHVLAEFREEEDRSAMGFVRSTVQHAVFFTPYLLARHGIFFWLGAAAIHFLYDATQMNKPAQQPEGLLFSGEQEAGPLFNFSEYRVLRSKA